MATITIPDKICPHCNGTRWKIEYEKVPTKSNPDKIKTRYRCAVRSEERRKRWNNAHVDERKAFFKQRDKRHLDELADKYLRRIWRANPQNRDYVLTKQDLDIYRNYLLTRRQIKHGK